jgi:hypothetical protein
MRYEAAVVSLVAVLACRGPGKSQVDAAPPPYLPPFACFAAGTRIATPAGEAAIETLLPGRVVLSYDLRDGRVVEGRVTAVHVHAARPLGRLALASGRVLAVTAEHPIYSVERGEFVAAAALAGGFRALALGQGGAVMPAVTEGFRAASPEQPATVYNLTVEPEHDYFAEGILVHNKERCWCEDSPAFSPPPGCPPCRSVVATESCPNGRGTAALPDEIARRTMSVVWGQVDEALLSNVRSGAIALGTKDQRRAFTQRLLEDPRARAGARAFIVRWLGLDADPPVQASPALWQSLRESALLFGVEALLEPASSNTMRDLWLRNRVFVDPLLAPLYGLPMQAAGFHAVEPAPTERVGLFTQGALMALHPNATARGEFLWDAVMECAPQVPWSPSLIDLHPPRSNAVPARAALAQTLTANPACAGGCHGLFDGVGLTLQHLDELGRVRSRDSDGAPIDVSGWLEQKDAPLRDYRDLASRVVDRAGACLAEQLRRHVQAVAAVDLDAVDAVCVDGWRRDPRYATLLVNLLELAAFARPVLHDGGLDQADDAAARDASAAP